MHRDEGRDARRERTSQGPMVGLAVGHVTRDALPSTDGATADGWVGGGSVLYAARTWAALGARPRVLSVVGDDWEDRGADWSGVECHLVHRAGPTTTFVNRYAADGSRTQWIQGVCEPVTPDLCPDAWRDPDVLFLAPVFGEVPLGAWKTATRARWLALGAQGWIKRPEHGPRRQPHRVVMGRWEVTAEQLAEVDVVCLSREDLVGDPGLVDLLVSTVPLVALTDGARGSDIFVRGVATHVDAFRTQEVDPTGAGDTFAAGLLYGLASGMSPLEAAHYGAVAASVVVEDVGIRALDRLSDAVRQRWTEYCS